MNKNIKSIIILFAAIAIIASCTKDSGKLPNISFKTGGSYVSADKGVFQGDTIIIGINASKSEDKDVLKTFTATRSYDNGTPTSFDQETLSGATADVFAKDFKIIARKLSGTEKYTFTVVNRDGLTNQVTLTLNVQ